MAEEERVVYLSFADGEDRTVTFTAEPDKGYTFSEFTFEVLAEDLSTTQQATTTENPTSMYFGSNITKFRVSTDFVWDFPDKFDIVDYATYYTGYYDEEGNPHLTGIEGSGTPYITLVGLPPEAYESQIKVEEETGAFGYTEDTFEVDMFWEADDYTLMNLENEEADVTSEDCKLVICRQNVENGVYKVKLTSVDKPVRTKEITIYVEIPEETETEEGA